MTKVVLDWDDKFKKGVIVSDHLDLIRDGLSIPNDVKAILSRRYGNSWQVPDRLHVITQSGRFDRGLFYEIIRVINKYEFEICITPLLQKKVFVESGEREPVKLNLKPREFQIEGVKKATRYGYGTFVVGTGGGKTLLMALIDQTFRAQKEQKTLVILPSHLIQQTSKDFIEYGIPEEDICVWTDEVEDKPIIIGSYKRLQARFAKDKKKFIDTFKDINLLLIDEVHQVRKKNQFNKILDQFHFVDNRFGFTGTLPESKLDKWNIIGKVGPILLDINSYELRQRGYLSNVKAVILKIFYNNPPTFKKSLYEPTKAYYEELAYIQNNSYRLNVIKQFCGNFQNNALILVDRLDQGEILHKVLKTLPEKQCFWIHGKIEVEEREDVRTLMEKDNNVICIAMSKIFSTGVNIKNLHYIVFAQGGKAKIRMVQSIGRGLRLHNQKERLLIIDIADMLPYGKEHLLQRIARYKTEKIEYEHSDFFESGNSRKSENNK